MNWNIFKRWRERREQKRKLKELKAFASAFSTMDTMAERGLLAWNMKTRQLFIDSSLAYVMMAKGADDWTNFVQNVYFWLYNQQAWQSTSDQMLKLELEAVRKYKKAHCKDGKQLSRQDVERIREARRREIVQEDIVQPKVEGFEFFIVSPPRLNENDNENENHHPSDISHQTSNPVGELVAVGHYDPETEQMEMATWEEVRSRLQAAE